MAVPSQPTTHSWNALPDGVAGEIFSRLTVDSSETGEVAEQIDRNDDAGTLQLMLGERSDTPPGPFRLVCQEWARQVASSAEELEPCGREQPPGWGQRFAHLRRLDLSRCVGLRLAASELRHLGGLQELRAPTSATDEDAASLGCLSSLTALDLGVCRRLTDAALAGVADMTALTSLDLQGCPLLTAAGLAALAALTALSSLNLAGCRALAGEALTAMPPSLVALTLDDNPCMDDTGLAALAPPAQPNLTSLSMQHCSGLTPEGFATGLPPLTTLTRLWLTGCPALAGAATAPLAHLTALEELSLAWCPLTDASTLPLAALSRLTALSLAGASALTDAALPPLAHLPALAALSLEDCVALTDAGAAAFAAGRPPLTSLDLNGCRAMGAPTLAEVLANLPSLRCLDMRGTRVAPAAAEAMAANHPHLRVRVRSLELST
eukprot:jgi/Tetstr1/422732/TSEL_013529.t1